MMKYATRPLNDRRTIVPGLKDLASFAVQRALTSARTLAAKRRDRPWLALVALPLAMTAAMCSLQLWLLPPLVLLCWYWGSEAGGWVWFLGIQEACFSVVWVFLGAATLAAFPQDRILVGIGWIAYAGIVLAAGCVNRWKFHRRFGW